MPDKDLEQLHAIDAELTPLVLALAAEVAQPVQQRDGAALRQMWGQIDAHRRSLSRLNRSLHRHAAQPCNKADRAARQRKRRIKDTSDALSERKGQWDAVARIVARHVDPPRRDLIRCPPPAPAGDLVDWTYDALHRLANPNPQTDTAKAHGCFADIPIPLRQFDALMDAAYRVLTVLQRAGSARFLDVGCGGGTKVYAARRYVGAADGLEYDPDYVRAARATMAALGAADSEIIHADALSFDGYDRYDLIYFYRPLREDDLIERLEQQIVNTARRGTLLLAPYDSVTVPRAGFDCARLDGALFITGYSQDEADALRFAAERTSPRLWRRKRGAAQWLLVAGVTGVQPLDRQARPAP